MPRRPPHNDYHRDIVPGQPGDMRGHIDFCQPKRSVLSFTFPSDQRYICPRTDKLTNFDEMCSACARELRFVSPDSEGTPDQDAYLIFSAAFAAANPELWKDFEEADPGRGGDTGSPRRIKIWEDLHDDLDIAANLHGKELTGNTGARAAAVWLAEKLHLHLSEPRSPENAVLAEFFDRYISGRNRREADGAPSLYDVQEETHASWLASNGQDGPVSSEDQGFLWDGIMEEYDREYWKWQFQRAELLRLPSLPPREVPFKHWVDELWGVEQSELPETSSLPSGAPPHARQREPEKEKIRVSRENSVPISVPSKAIEGRDLETEEGVVGHHRVRSILASIESRQKGQNTCKETALEQAIAPFVEPGSSEPIRTRVPRVVPLEAQQALRLPYEATLYTLGFGRNERPSEKRLYGCKIIDRLVVNRPQKQVIASAFIQAVAEGGNSPVNRVAPLYALRVTSQGHVYDFLLVFDVALLVIFKDDLPIARLRVTESPEHFVRLCHAADLPVPGGEFAYPRYQPEMPKASELVSIIWQPVQTRIGKGIRGARKGRRKRREIVVPIW